MPTFTVQVEDMDLHKRYKVVSALSGVTIREMVHKALTEYVDARAKELNWQG